MTKKPLTESDSHYDHLEKMTIGELLSNINQEDQKVAGAVKKCIPEIERLVTEIVIRMKKGGRLFYVGAGTSGRLGIVDASECPPTFGVPHDLVIGIMAGGDGAIRKAVEFAEDDPDQGWKDLQVFEITKSDTIIGIAASGRTPYVIGAVKSARDFGCLTGCITCNEDSRLAEVAEHPIEALVGPEFVTGSTRMKAGTAQKLILNMISTTVMIQLGHVHGNKMVDMQLSNEKLIERGVEIIANKLNVTRSEARELLEQYGSVRKILQERGLF
ncbi:MAG: N-acetylmuramic acid 6-phosphate etherase [Ekhidna sp.]|uniref:N-acetylmuramic acid 6-phosphate etherase n=1 Tax=Ekhidna sp. TaxID=2608089 RepID=UPI0032EC4265